MQEAELNSIGTLADLNFDSISTGKKRLRNDTRSLIFLASDKYEKEAGETGGLFPQPSQPQALLDPLPSPRIDLPRRLALVLP